MEQVHNVCRIIFIIAIINFFAFILINVMIGGDAINGHETAGHYYLASHGKLTEVSYFVFMYSKIHVFSVFITHALAMLAGIVYFVTGGKKKNFW